jgi:hypothetical protein
MPISARTLSLSQSSPSIPFQPQDTVYVHSGSALSPLDEAGRGGSRGKGAIVRSGQLTTGIHFHCTTTKEGGDRSSNAGLALERQGRGEAPRTWGRKMIYHGKVRGPSFVCVRALLFAPFCWVQRMSLFLFQEHPHTHTHIGHTHAITHTHIHTLVRSRCWYHWSLRHLPCPVCGCCMLPSGCYGQTGQSTGANANKAGQADGVAETLSPTRARPGHVPRRSL